MNLHPVSHQITCKHHIFLCLGHIRKYCPPSRTVNFSYVLGIAVTNLPISSTTLRNLYFAATTVSSHCPFPSSLSHGSSSSSELHLLFLLPDSQTAVRGWNTASVRDGKRCQLAKLINLITKGWNGPSMSWLSWSWAVVLNTDVLQCYKTLLSQCKNDTKPSHGYR